MPSKRLRRAGKLMFPAERLALTLDSTLRNVDLAERLIRRFCKKVGCNERQENEIGVAVRESVANAVLHGNGSDAAKKVVLAVELRNSHLAISVQDEGKGFDPDSLPDPIDPRNLLREGGRGFFLVKASMDEVALRLASSGLEITMVKYLSKTALRRTIE